MSVSDCPSLPDAVAEGEVFPLTVAAVVLATPGGSANSRRSIRQRLGTGIRRIVGVALVVVALWWLVLPLVFPVTSDAIVNARTVQVRAPIDGTATALVYDVQDTVVVGQPMAHLDNRQLDTSGLTGLTTRRAELVSRRERLGKELVEVVRSETAYRAEAIRYRDAVVDNLAFAERECKSREQAARVELDAASRRVQRLEGLVGRTVSELEAEQEKQSVCRNRLLLEQASLA